MVEGQTWTATFVVRNDGANSVALRASIGAATTYSGPNAVVAPGETATLAVTATMGPGVTAGRAVLRAGAVLPIGTVVTVMDNPGLEMSAVVEPGFNGGSIDEPLRRTRWAGAVNNSDSIYETRETISVIPVRDVTTQAVLYGDRITRYRWEVLEHANGIDQLVGTLDGVSDGSLIWTQNAAVKGGGKAQVVDLSVANPGMLRIADLKLESVRLRPVCVIEGLPENPLGIFLVSAAREDWEDTGRVYSLELLDKCTVPSQDVVDQSYAVAAGTLILAQVKTILASSNEFIAVDASNTLTTSSGMVWEAGTSKLKIINDLLDVAGYNSLWMDGMGNFQATPRVLPANRSILYEVLGIPRELVDGQQGIYRPQWELDRDSFDVPNKVIAIQAAGGEDVAALVGQWTNTDPSSPYSYIARGRWVPHVLDSVETPEGTDPETVAFLQNRARATLVQMSAVQATVKVEHLPIPVRVSDVLRFANTKAGVDGRHVITRIQLDTHPLGMMSSTPQEVISL